MEFANTTIKIDYPLRYSTKIIEAPSNHFFNLKKCFYIVDDFFQDRLHLAQPFWFSAVEKNKSLSTVQKILQRLHNNSFQRDDQIVAIGGGITLDLAAFVSSIYQRGCRLVLIPTTLVSMLDASIGGKTGLNYHYLKNQIGSFYPAHKIILDYDFLHSLPPTEVKNGYAELIKIMIIKDRFFFLQDFTSINNNLPTFIKKAIQFKLEFCTPDLLDQNTRQILNLGHTFAHLLETISKYRISHGASVAWGLKCALQISVEKELLAKDMYQMFISYLDHFCHIHKLSPKQKTKITKEGIKILWADKKANNLLKLILVNNEAVEIQHFHQEEIQSILQWLTIDSR